MYGACFKVGQSRCVGTYLKICSGTSDEMLVACTKVVEEWKQVGGSESLRKVRNLDIILGVSFTIFYIHTLTKFVGSLPLVHLIPISVHLHFYFFV